MSSHPTQESQDDAATPTRQQYTGQSMHRVEDHEILTGRADYIHDRIPDDALEMMLVRSVHAHADIVEIDVEEARAHPKCRLVLTAEDVKAEYNPMPLPLDGFDEWPLADGKTRFVGEPVAAVIVEGDRYVAEDVADLVSVEYETHESVVDAHEARTDSVVIHDSHGTNVAASECFTFGDVNETFEDADHVITDQFSWGRISGVPLETAGVIATYDDEADAFTIDSNIQLHTLVNDGVCSTLGYPDECVDMRVPSHIGGSYGNKIGSVTRYCCLSAIASKALNAPVAFVEDRLENLQGGDAHSTEREYEVALAVDDDGSFRGLDVWFVDDMGAYPRYAINQVLKPLSMVSGAYEIPSVQYEFEVVLTNKTSQAPYRGFGIQPQNYVLEGIIETAATELDIDPTVLRRQNMVSPAQMPYVLPTKNVYDSGDYPTALDQLQELVDSEYEEDGLLNPDVVQSRRDEGKYRGMRPLVLVEPGVVQSDWRDRWTFEGEYEDRTTSDITGIPEHVRSTVHEDGSVTVFLATDSAGQGHQTVAIQLLADELEILPSNIDVEYLGSAEAPTDYGSAGSRLGVMLSGAATNLGTHLRENLEQLAAAKWDCPTEDVTYQDGEVVRVDSSASLSLGALAAYDRDQGTDQTTVAYDHDHPTQDRTEYTGALTQKLPSYATTSFAANAAIVEVDIHSGEIDLLRFYSVRDCGTQLNPEIVEGQEMGGVVQGVGAALLEEFGYDSESGQPQAITLFDYLLPSTETVPEMVFEHTETPSPFTETGAKGVGESGITDAPASIAASLTDALSPFDVTVDKLPFTPHRAREKLRDEVEQDDT